MLSEPVVHVIDDDDAARDSLAFLLEIAEHRVRTYDSAQRFLMTVPKLEPGCIITDVRMPDMTGLELVAQLKSIGVTEPVIVITGHADVPMVIQAMKQGIADFIEKPFSKDAILTAVDTALSRRSARERLRDEGERVDALIATLSQRERDVLERLLEGHANKTIAYDLSISARTVEVYRANVMSKMRAGSLSELVRMVTVAQLT